MRTIAILVLIALLSACGADKNQWSQNPPAAGRYSALPIEERAKLAPNKLFIAVYDGRLAEVETELKRDPSLLTTVNGYGDTPAGLALKAAETRIADRLLSRLSVEDLPHQNQSGETYVFLAAKSGQTDLIRLLANRYYQSLPPHYPYSFSYLDRPTEAGQTALFVAANREVAEVLETEYYRGPLDFPSWTFRLRADKKSQTFLHQAAHDGRADIILWASSHICKPGSWETSESYLYSLPARAAQTLLRLVQTYIGDFGLPVDLIFNRQNSEKRTALHVALSRRDWNSARALASCRWLDHDLPDQDGRLPLHVFLAGLNSRERAIQSEVRSVFQFLLHQETTLRRPIWSRANRVNYADQNGDTALHLAARLADPYFYQELKNLGDIHALNKAGQSPAQILARKTAGILNGH